MKRYVERDNFYGPQSRQDQVGVGVGRGRAGRGRAGRGIMEIL